MTVDRRMISKSVISESDRAPADEVPTGVLVGYVLAALGLVGWFLFGWLVQQQGFVDSVGESAGAGFGLLLAVSVIGTVRRSRR